MKIKEALVGFLIAAAVVSASLWLQLSQPALDASFYLLPVATFIAALFMITIPQLIGYAAFYVLAESVIYGQHLYVTSRASYTGSPGEGIGLALLMLTTMGLVAGVIFNLVARFAWRKWESFQAIAADRSETLGYDL